VRAVIGIGLCLMMTQVPALEALSQAPGGAQAPAAGAQAPGGAPVAAGPQTPAAQAPGGLPVPGGPQTPAAAPAGQTPAVAPPAVPADYVLNVARLPRPPALTGRGDDPIWQQATLAGAFTQYEPKEGQPPTERTEMRIGYDAENLYFAFYCHDAQAAKIVASTMQRDGDQSTEDHVQLILDTFHDRSSGFLFSVNPLGAMFDAVVRREGEDVNSYWDGLWQAKTARDALGWTAELVIPFKTLRFPNQAAQVWGFNVERFIARKGEQDFWKPLPRGFGIFGPYKISSFGELRGLTGLTPARGFQAVPYALLSGNNEQLQKGVSGNAGGDLKMTLTSNLTADLTYRTDFAEAEADLQQVNLTPYKIQYPEKRGFFLENTNLFYFGDRGPAYESNERFNFFFSRDIGLTPDGLEEVPIIGGGKLSGKIGDLGVGVLNLTTGPLTYIDAAGNKTFQPTTNYSVVRLREDIFDGSTIGLMALDKDAAGDRNAGLGLDWDFHLFPHLSSAGWMARTDTPGLTHEDNAYSADLLYQTPTIRAWTEYNLIGTNFNPEIGFLSRDPGYKKSQSDFYYFAYPEWGDLHRFTASEDFDHVTDLAGNVLSQIARTELLFVGKTNNGLAVLATSDLEVLTTPFNIYKNIFIPDGTYRFSDIFIGFGSDYTKPAAITTWFQYGNYYDGNRLHTLVSVGSHPVVGFQGTLSWERSQIHLLEGDFITDLVYADLLYSFSPTLFVRSLIQWDKVDNLRVNALIDWTYRPGSDFYLVYNDIRDLDPARRLLPFDSALPGASLTAKVAYRFDF
jgi:hypothetical protein